MSRFLACFETIANTFSAEIQQYTLNYYNCKYNNSFVRFYRYALGSLLLLIFNAFLTAFCRDFVDAGLYIFALNVSMKNFCFL